MTSSASTRTFFNEKPSRISKSSFKRERLASEDVYTTELRTFESHRGLVPLLFSPGTRPFAAKFRGRMSSDFHPFSFRNRSERERQEKGAKAWKRQRNSGERNVKGTDRFRMKLTHSIARLFPLSILPSSLWVRRKLALSPGYHKRVCLCNVIEQLSQNRYFFVMLFDPLSFCFFPLSFFLFFLCPSESPFTSSSFSCGSKVVPYQEFREWCFHLYPFSVWPARNFYTRSNKRLV